MIDFSTLQGLTIPEGVVTKITDASGRVLWMLQTNEPIVLEVTKITSDTYAGEVTYTEESFILLDIYPQRGGTVTVTYGGLTKTITDDGTSGEPNAQQVFFGTFNGVTDEAETPASGTLTIKGDCRGFGCGPFTLSSKLTTPLYCNCITNISEWESSEIIPGEAFYECDKITSIIIPDGVSEIGGNSFYDCVNLNYLFIPASVETIGCGDFYVLNDSTFMNCKKLVNLIVDENSQYFAAENGALFNKDKTILVAYPSASGSYTVPATVTDIKNSAFYNTAVTDVTIPAGMKYIRKSAFYNCSDLKTFTILATTPPSIDSDGIFISSNVPSIYVPAGCGEAYKTAESWSVYADYIVEASA